MTAQVLNFIDDAEEPVTLVHGLRLHPLDGSAPNQRVPVLAEFLEDIVFGDDTSAGLLAALHAHPQAPVALPAPHPLMPGATEQSDEAETGRIAAALLTVKQQTQARAISHVVVPIADVCCCAYAAGVY